MKAYAEELRQRIVQAVNDGASQPVIADRYSVGLKSVKRYVKQWRATGSLAPQPRPGRPRAISPADPDATVAAYCDRWGPESVLVSRLGAGQSVALDNLSVHKDKQMRPLIEGAGCTLASLPAYPPALTPIEQASGKITEYLRRVEARTREGLAAAITAAMALVTAEDAKDWPTHCGYTMQQAQEGSKPR